MKADWKIAAQLPEKRTRVLICDNLGFIQTAFYGRQTNGDNKECWRSDEIDREIEIKVAFWDYFPETPIKPTYVDILSLDKS